MDCDRLKLTSIDMIMILIAKSCQIIFLVCAFEMILSRVMAFQRYSAEMLSSWIVMKMSWIYSI